MWNVTSSLYSILQHRFITWGPRELKKKNDVFKVAEHHNIKWLFEKKKVVWEVILGHTKNIPGKQKDTWILTIKDEPYLHSQNKRMSSFH